MKLKCRINGEDYDIVQGATFVDNFNETLDSATIVLDHVQKIDGIRQYDDVFIWNADEEFYGYGNPDDIAELDGKATVGGDTVGPGIWTDMDPSPSMTIEDKGAYFKLSGPVCQIWAYMFYGFTEQNERTCRYGNLTMDIEARFITYALFGSTEHTEHEFRIEAANGKTHGAYGDEIVLTNGTRSFKCIYDPDTQSFAVGKGQDMTLLKSLRFLGARCQLDDIKKTFDIQVFTDDFSDSGITDFEIGVLYRGKTYIFTMVGIEEIDELTMTVTFDNPELGYLGITFTHGQGDEWNSEGLRNVEPTVSDPSGIFGEVDGISISSLMGVRNGTKPLPTFYKHLLFDKFPEEQVGLETGLYRCTIDLFSETKRLEKIVLPNISITQSLVQEKKRSCWFYMKEYVEAFSPKYKKVSNKDERKWRYVSKYSLSESGTDQNGVIANLKEVFDSVICPEMSLTNPSLKDLLAQIMIVKDMIPIVKDDVIYALDIGNTTGDFDRTNVNFVNGTLNSDDFATDARREHSNALSQENSAHMVEYLGFRAPNSAFLTLDELTLETRFPIYKINSIKMCYYKKAILEPGTGSSLPRTERYFLCKQDITPLVLQNTVRNTLSTNWKSFRNPDIHPTSVHDFSDIVYQDGDGHRVTMDFARQYKLCTIGYDIGSNRLTGWGTKYQYLDFLWFKNECTYIENIVNLVDAINPYGLTNPIQLKGGEGYAGVTVSSGVNNIIPLDGTDEPIGVSIAKRIKSIVFEVDYDAMYCGAIMHGKENIDRDDIVTADNCNSALTVLEADGLYEREKMDRIGNKVFKMTARYDKDNGGADPNKVQNVGTYDEETDSIIYSREYQVYDNAIFANYESTHEYVLKNYFTTVWAKYRTYSLMSYGESIRRAENTRKFLLLSKEAAYHENDGGTDEMLFSDTETAKQFLSFITPSKIDEGNGTVKHDEKLNCGYFVFYTGEEGNTYTGIYLSDINAFSSGTSLCFNIATYDNISGGNYIDEMSADMEGLHFVSEEEEAQKALDYKTTQLWWNMVESADDAFVKNVGFFVCHLNNDAYFHDSFIQDPAALALEGEKYLKLPQAYFPSEFFPNSNMRIGVSKKPLCKDNKEIIDMTMQFDYLAENRNDIAFSPWISKLNDLIGHYDKFDTDGFLKTDYVGGAEITCFAYDASNKGSGPDEHRADKLAFVVIKIKEDDFLRLEAGNPFASASIPVSFSTHGGIQGSITVYDAKGQATLSLNDIAEIGENDSITVHTTISGKCECRIYNGGGPFIWNEETGTLSVFRTPDIVFEKAATATENGETYYYLRGSIPADSVSCKVSDVNTKRLLTPCWAYFRVFEMGNYDPRDLDDTNSLVVKASVAAEQIKVRSFIKNMFVVASSAKADRKLEYTLYKYDAESDPAVNTFPEGFFVDAEASVENVFSVFEDESGAIGIYVNPSRYEDNQSIPFAVRSLQYYYRDDSGTMHFVFGANLPEISQGKMAYDPFSIYLSAVSKRRMDVFDESHNIVGRAKNALLDPEKGFSDQYYEPVGHVPSAYKKAKYLESDGNQIIHADSAIVSETTSVECDFMALRDGNQVEAMFGKLGSDGLLMRRDGSEISLSVASQGSSLSTAPVAIDIGRRYSAKATSNGLSLNGVQVAWIHGVMYRMEPTRGIDVFGVSLNGSIFGNGFIGRIYGLKIYEEGVLAHDLVPCVRLSDNEPGMYDTMTGQFHTNAGTGDFKVRF